MSKGSHFTEEYKREAVRKAEVNQNVSRTARERGIANKTLHQWIKQFGASPDAGCEYGDDEREPDGSQPQVLHHWRGAH